jgi:hypothetical protein
VQNHSFKEFKNLYISMEQHAGKQLPEYQHLFLLRHLLLLFTLLHFTFFFFNIYSYSYSYSYLLWSGGQSSNLYLNVDLFLQHQS